jgi:DNA-binding PadR family transcriptional regulator
MSKTAANPKDFLPLTPISFHILLALSDHSHHGYGLLKEVKQMTGGKVKLSTGTLYNAINRLLKARLIMVVSKESSQPAGASSDNDLMNLDKRDEPELTRYYRITGLGQRTLEAELQRIDEIARPARPQPAFEGVSTIRRHAG